MTIKQILSWCPWWSKEPPGPLSTDPKKEEKIQALSQEMKLTKKIVDREQGKWLPCTRKDVTKEQAVIIKLANRLIEILSKVFANLLKISHERPMTSQEEERLARVAKELQNACEISGQDGLATNWAEEADAAKARAKAIEQRDENRANESVKAERLVHWAKTPRHDTMRNLPAINYVFWTRQGANEQASRIRVHLAEQNVQTNRDYPKLLKPCLEELIIHKEVLVKLLKPGSREYYGVSREIQEHSIQIKKMVALDSAERRVQALRLSAEQAPTVPVKLVRLNELVGAQKHLATLLTMNTPKHRTVAREIQMLEQQMRNLSASLRRS